MKNLLLAMCITASLALVAAHPGLAAGAQNEIGIYMTETGVTPYIQSVTPFMTYNLYFVVSNPRFPDGSGPMPTLDAFEFKVRTTPATGCFVLSELKPPQNIDVGLGYDSAAGTRDYAVGWPTPLPVVNGVVKVMSWNVLFANAGPYEFYLAPGARPTIPGFMAIECTRFGDPYLAACTPSSGAFSLPVFAAGHTVVATDSKTFGDVKALFR